MITGIAVSCVSKSPVEGNNRVLERQHETGLANSTTSWLHAEILCQFLDSSQRGARQLARARCLCNG
jgi:hypothetical protein